MPDGATPELLSDLRAAAGDAAVSATPADLGAYARDLWPKLTLGYREGVAPRRPAAVVRPADEQAVLRTVRAAVRHGLPIVAYGAGSGVCGGAAPLHGGVVVDLKRLDHLEAVDAGSMQVTCGPGIILQNLEERLNDAGWTLGHFPSSIFAASIGGCVAARGAGQLSSRYGKIEDMVTGLRVVTPGQGIVATGSLESRARGLDWTPLFVGSEGTLGLITAIRLRVHPLPGALVLRGLRFPTVRSGIDGFREVLQSGLRPSVMRLYDPLDTWMAMQKADDAGGASPTPGGGRPLVGGARARRAEVAAQPGGVPPKDSATPRVMGSVVSPGTFTDSAIKGASRGRSLFKRAFGRKGGLREAAKATVLGGVANRLVGDQLKHLLKPENMPVDKLLTNPSLLNRSINMLPERCLAIFGAEGDPAVASEMVEAIVAAGGRLGAIDLGAGPGEQWFRTRYHVSFKMPKLLIGGGFADTFETAAPWSRVEPLYDAVRKAVSPHVLVMAHMSHAYHEGCSIYFTFVGYGRTPAEADRRYESTWNAAMDAALSVGATLTHHHGVGALKRDFMDREHGAARMLFEAARAAVDEDRVLNIGKLFPDAVPPSTGRDEAPDPKALIIPDYEDGVAVAGAGWRGVDLLAELELRGHFVPPLGREFLESTVEEWLRSGAVAAHHAVHGAWEHPVLAVEGLLPDGRLWRSGRLPRSAAGPSYLPFGLGDADGALPVTPTLVTLRSLSSPLIRMVGFVFDHMDTAVTALREALRGAPPPHDGMVFAGTEPGGFRTVVQDAKIGRDGGVVFLAFVDPDGFPSGTQQVVDRLVAAGGRPTTDQEALDWYEDQWGCAHREGAGVLDATGPMPRDDEIGRGAATVGWGKALQLLRAVETLTGGKTRAFGWIDAPRETGCTVRWRFTSTRPGDGAYTLLHHQVRESIRSFGAREIALTFRSEEGIPEEAFGGRGTPLADDAGTTASERLTAAVATALGDPS